MLHRMMVLLAVLLVGFVGAAQAGEAFDQTHKKLDDILKTFVKDGLVDYSGLKLSQKLLNSYIDDLGSISEDELNFFTVDQKLAYWLNFYNACFLDAVSQNSPLLPLEGQTAPNARQIEGLWTAYKWETPVGRRNLNGIETYIEKYSKGMWVFGINRGTIGGPKMLSEAFQAEQVHQQLDKAARLWMADPKNWTVNVEKRHVQVSEFLQKQFLYLKSVYFKRGEFLSHSEFENICANYYLALGADDAAKEMIRLNEFTVGFFPYDLSLNEWSAGK